MNPAATHIAQHLKATGTNACGRLLRVDDGSGYQIFSYDKLGNVAENIRAIALPFEDSVYNFRMLFEYDTWNRVQRIFYPDSEVVSYSYDLGGQLYSVSAFKNNVSSSLINSILYDEFGHRTQVVFGNGITTNYTYDNLQRLSTLQTYSNNASLQKISYSFDLEDNITKVENTAGGANGLGGAYAFDYQYDNLYRLTSSTGTFAPNGASYGLEMDFTPAGRVCRKFQDYTGTGNVYAYSQNSKQHAVRRIYNGLTNELSNLRWDNNGNLAQQTVYSVNNNVPTFLNMRMLFWDEDDRLNLVAGDGYLSYYAYGHDGNRAIKMTGNAAIDQSGTLLNSTNLENITIYPNEYLAVTQAEYTKYYYAGGNRIASKIGTGGFEKMTRLCTLDQGPTYNANTLLNFVLYQVTNTTQPPTDEYPVDVCAGYNVSNELLHSPLPDFYISQTNLNFTQNNLLQQFRQNLTNSVEPVYYFHSDHLGSASWITSGTGAAVQHLLYLPFGEHFVNEQSTGYNERFTFTGKERDAETGYYYHGARFNSSDIGWLSVDPMAEKYPEITPYHYCHWNPIKLIDPTGEFDFYIHQIMVRKAFKNSNSSLTAEQQKLVIKGTGLHSDVTLSKDNTVHMDSYNPQVMIESEIFGCFIETYNNAIQNYGKNINKGEYLDAGVNLHTIADFYSHSNYIELYEEYAKDNKLDLDIDAIPTFSEAQNDEKLMNFLNGRLKSGIFPNDNDKIKESHKGINKDNYLFSKNGHKQYTDKFKSSRYKVARRVAEKEILNLIKRNEEE